MQGSAIETKPYLLVSKSFASAPARALYCSNAPPDFKRELLERLLR